MIRFHSSTSTGGCPVRGKMQHSSVPRKNALCPFSTNCVPWVFNSQKPKVVFAESARAGSWGTRWTSAT